MSETRRPVRPRRHARDGVARTLARWVGEGHDVDPGTVAALEVAAHGVDLALAQAVAGKGPGRSATLAAQGLAAMLRAAAPPTAGDDLDDLFRSLMDDAAGT